MRLNRIHDFFVERLIVMFGITSVIGWVCTGFSVMVQRQTAAEFLLGPSGVEQIGLTIYVVGIATIVFIPFYWIQMKVFQFVSSKANYTRSIAIINSYGFCVIVIVFLGGLIAGQILVPVFLISPGLYLSLWVFRLLSS
jgi:hypothetical protein